jgi:hypothetical protein
MVTITSTYFKHAKNKIKKRRKPMQVMLYAFTLLYLCLWLNFNSARVIDLVYRVVVA